MDDLRIQTRTCPVCGATFIVPKAHSKDYAYIFIDKTQGNLGKKIFLCSWTCQRKMQYEYIMSKDKLIAKDVKWLQAHGYEVPADKMPKWMMEPAKKRKRKVGTDGI